MRTAGKRSYLCELADEHEEIVTAAIEDGRVTVFERRQIEASLGRLRSATARQAVRTKLVVRMASGGDCDREIAGDIAHWQRLKNEETAECANIAAA